MAYIALNKSRAKYARVCKHYMIQMLDYLTNLKVLLHFVPEIPPESILLLGSG